MVSTNLPMAEISSGIEFPEDSNIEETNSEEAKTDSTKNEPEKESHMINSEVPGHPKALYSELLEPHSFGQMFQWLIAEDEKMDQCLLSFQYLREHMQHLVWIAVMGLAAHGLFMGWFASHTNSIVSGYPVFSIPFAMVGAFLGGLLICLPSFYFYTQLAGLDIPFALICAFAIRVLAKTSVLLFGLLPFFIAFTFLQPRLGTTSEVVLVVGLIFPFIVGFWGLRTMYYAFGRMSHLFPKQHQHRGNFLLRIVMAWGGVYLTVAPVALHHLFHKIHGLSVL